MILELEYIFSSFIFVAGFIAVVLNKNILKTIIGLSLMGYSVCLFFVVRGYTYMGQIPIIEQHETSFRIVDPLVQSLVMLLLLIELLSLVLLSVMAYKIHKHYGTLNLDEIRKLKG
ncbi:MAG: NADH-quinone oxidoreductase subunit K [Endomicrobiales bacterium]|nr:NADH-quinone oxidoreductase subunit K [Endomicrobiales bacterium]